MKRAIEFLKNGKIVAFKTDTVMGLGVNGLDKLAVKRLFDIKKRSYEKPVSVLLPTVEQLFKYVVVNKTAFEIIKKHFPGAITCILEAKECVYTTPLGCGETIGVRIPKFVKLQEFLSKLDFPIIATSANISGSAPLLSKDDVVKIFGDAVYYLDFGYNVKMSGVASTVVDCTNDIARILRKGSVNL